MTTDAKLLKNVLEKHRRHVQDSRAFLKGDGEKLVVSSSNIVGVIMRSVIPSTDRVSACIISESLSSILRAAKEVSLKSEEGRLLITSGRIKADLPVESGEVPFIPNDSDKRTIVADADVRRLTRIINLVDLPRLEKSGQLSIRCKDGEMYVSCTDQVHGAIYYGKSKANLEFGVFPQDSALLKSVLAGSNKVSFAYSEGRLIVSTRSERVVIPTTECAYYDKATTKATKTVAKTSAEELKEALGSISAIASVKEASPVMFMLGDNGFLVKASSSLGVMSTKLKASVKASTKFGMSYGLLSNLIPKMKEEVMLAICLEDNEVTQVQFTSSGVTYAALTSSL